MVLLKKNKRKEFIKLVIKYLHFRKSFNFGLQRYYFWKRNIEYITEIKEQKYVRSIFNTLLSKGVLVKRKENNLIKYLFNPNNMYDEKILETRKLLVTF